MRYLPVRYTVSHCLQLLFVFVYFKNIETKISFKLKLAVSQLDDEFEKSRKKKQNVQKYLDLSRNFEKDELFYF